MVLFIYCKAIVKYMQKNIYILTVVIDDDILSIEINDCLSKLGEQYDQEIYKDYFCICKGFL